MSAVDRTSSVSYLVHCNILHQPIERPIIQDNPGEVVTHSVCLYNNNNNNNNNNIYNVHTVKRA